MLTGRLKRGKVELRAAVESTAPGRRRGEPSTRLLQRLNGVQDGIRAWLPSARELSVADVLRIAAGDSTSAGDWSSVLADVTQKTLDSLVERANAKARRLAAMLKTTSASCASSPPRPCRWCRNWSSSNAPASSSAGRTRWASPAARCLKPRRSRPERGDRLRASASTWPRSSPGSAPTSTRSSAC